MDTDPASRATAVRRALSKCNTDALFQWLADENLGGRDTNLVVLELIDRLGWKAWDLAIEKEDPAQRKRLTNLLLWGYSERDPWKAYELWKAERSNYEDSEWGIAAYGGALGEATKLSASRVMEILDELPDLPDRSSIWLRNVEFSSDFDFKTVLEFLIDQDSQPRMIPNDLLRRWSVRSPAEAAEWLASHPEVLDIEHLRDDAENTSFFPDDPASPDFKSIVQALDRLPSDFLDDLWGSAVIGSDGKVRAGTLAAADEMGRREDFLREVLLQTRFQDQPDSSWELVPREERRHLVELVEQSWAKDPKSPVEVRAHERWRKGLNEAWGIGP
ncbi:hypothetical protein [Luteolibacter luteus]|uniref:Uncharacterized protein n=1 Tax=Luteolibacter luteus TaxID=2728835 RepID=A0A858RK72_9BACT|nr:hypothetical protein [Luteolibacter luteus]QJE96600.1 hypothetical protein HHL09_12665 [Luteolibacter luteus]